MTGYFAKRLGGMLLVLLLVSLLSFAIIALVPGDPAAAFADASATPQQLARLRHELGLDLPIGEQMLAWYGRLLHGDLGRSILLRRSVGEALVERLPVTLSLAAIALVIAALVGVAAGTLAAVYRARWPDQSVMVAALLGLSVPDFWLGLMLIFFFGVRLGWLPTGGFVPPDQDFAGWLRSIALPAATLAAVQIGFIARMTRASVLDVLHQDFIRTADAKGLARPAVLMRHALPNAVVPILTVAGIVAGSLLGGAVIVEQVFSIPGVGRLIVGAILSRDYPVIQGGLLFLAAIYLFVNFAVDLLYAVADRGYGWSDRQRAPAAWQPGVPARGCPGAAHRGGRRARRRAHAVRSAAKRRAAAARPPDAMHWFGTDHFGRDILAAHAVRRPHLAHHRPVHGGPDRALRHGDRRGRRVLPAAGPPDHAADGRADGVPAILLAIAVAAVLGASVPNVIIALAVATTPHTARIVRASVLGVRALDFVEAARAIGMTELRVLWRHVLPNVAGPLIVRLTYVFATAILAEAALSFIGVGPPPPAPTFGNIIANGRDFIADAPWVTIFPGLAVIVSVLGLNLLGDGLRDVLDPRART